MLRAKSIASFIEIYAVGFLWHSCPTVHLNSLGRQDIRGSRPRREASMVSSAEPRTAQSNAQPNSEPRRTLGRSPQIMLQLSQLGTAVGLRKFQVHQRKKFMSYAVGIKE